MVIWREYKSYAEASSTLRKKNCWTCCDHCRGKWGNIQPATKNVHMVVRDVQEKTVTRFICDGCANEITPIGTEVKIKGAAETLGEIDAYRMKNKRVQYVVNGKQYDSDEVEAV